MNILNYQEMIDYLLSKLPEESGGFVIDNLFHPKNNIAEDKLKDCQFDPQDYIECESIQATVHSHPYSELIKDEFGFDIDPRTPSMIDMILQDQTDVPCIIVSIN